MAVDALPEPPPAPSAPRRVRLYAFQWFGLALLAVLPLLAALGQLGETWDEATMSGDALDVSVRWPTRFRYKQLNSITVQVRNVGVATRDTVTVSLDTALANRFSTVRAIPAFARAYEAEITDLRPGESRLVVVELQAEEYGSHTGALTIESGEALRMPLSIRIFP